MLGILCLKKGPTKQILRVGGIVLSTRQKGRKKHFFGVQFQKKSQVPDLDPKAGNPLEASPTPNRLDLPELLGHSAPCQQQKIHPQELSTSNWVVPLPSMPVINESFDWDTPILTI